MKKMKALISIALLSLLTVNMAYSQQMNTTEYRISVDVGHDQIFWGDPSNTQGMPADRADRVQYLNEQLQSNASSLNAELTYLHEEIKASDLSGSDLLYIHVPSSSYSENEVEAITNFLEDGGSLFLAMDVDFWSTLEQANVNDVFGRYGIEFGPDSPDTEVGALTREGLITGQAVKIPYHGGRSVIGGTPFSFSVGPESIPFGAFAELDSGSRIIVMGDAMASLYMNSWQEVNDYQTEEFMQDVLQWLLDYAQ